MASIALLLFGPSAFLGLPPNLSIMLTGFYFLAGCIAFIYVPILAEIIAAVAEKEGL